MVPDNESANIVMLVSFNNKPTVVSFKDVIWGYEKQIFLQFETKLLIDLTEMIQISITTALCHMLMPPISYKR